MVLKGIYELTADTPTPFVNPGISSIRKPKPKERTEKEEETQPVSDVPPGSAKDGSP